VYVVSGTPTRLLGTFFQPLPERYFRRVSECGEWNAY